MDTSSDLATDLVRLTERARAFSSGTRAESTDALHLSHTFADLARRVDDDPRTDQLMESARRALIAALTEQALLAGADRIEARKPEAAGAARAAASAGAALRLARAAASLPQTSDAARDEAALLVRLFEVTDRLGEVPQRAQASAGLRAVPGAQVEPQDAGPPLAEAPDRVAEAPSTDGGEVELAPTEPPPGVSPIEPDSTGSRRQTPRRVLSYATSIGLVALVSGITGFAMRGALFRPPPSSTAPPQTHASITPGPDRSRTAARSAARDPQGASPPSAAPALKGTAPLPPSPQPQVTASPRRSASRRVDKSARAPAGDSTPRAMTATAPPPRRSPPPDREPAVVAVRVEEASGRVGRGEAVITLFRSQPAGAEVVVNGAYRGRTPLGLEEPPGTVLSVIVRHGTTAWHGRIRVGYRRQVVVTVRFPVVADSPSPRPPSSAAVARAGPTAGGRAASSVPGPGPSAGASPAATAPSPVLPSPSPALPSASPALPSPSPAPPRASAEGHFDRLMAQGIRFYHAGWYGPAMGRFRQATLLAPRSPRAWLWVGRAAFRSGRYAEARVALLRAIAVAPDSPTAAEARALLRLLDHLEGSGGGGSGAR